MAVVRSRIIMRKQLLVKGLHMPERFNTQFWQMVDKLVAQTDVIVDRPKDSQHPDWDDMIYPLDYGYLAGTSSSDGSGIDVFLGNGDHKRVTAVVCTVDLLKRDSEIKILLGCTEDDMQTITDFVNSGDNMGCFLVRRTE